MSLLIERPETQTKQRLAIIDTDVHPTVRLTDAIILDNLSERWRTYIQRYGLGNLATEHQIPTQREFTHRLDALDEDGLVAHDPLFTRQQLLDEYDMSGAVLFDASALMMTHGGNNFPEQLNFELTRVYNDAHAEVWLKADPRYYSVIHVPVEFPLEAVKEIERVKNGPMGDRFVSIGLEPRTEYPIGNPKYWPIFEAAEHYNIPLTFHTSPGRRMTGSGPATFYYEWHSGFPLRNYTVASSFIFEGVFDRFPNLHLSLIEQSWSWAAPFAWRMDKSWNMMRDEIPDLQRMPSEYMKEHFYFATQPMEEPENLEDYLGLQQQFESVFGTDRLMFSSDYPHWDFDSPYESVPPTLPLETRRKIFGENASRLYGIKLLPDTGVVIDS
jgi:predicted TIM-barrel fold metal-dependent hydrolase